MKKSRAHAFRLHDFWKLLVCVCQTCTQSYLLKTKWFGSVMTPTPDYDPLTCYVMGLLSDFRFFQARLHLLSFAAEASKHEIRRSPLGQVQFAMELRSLQSLSRPRQIYRKQETKNYELLSTKDMTLGSSGWGRHWGEAGKSN